MSTKPVLKLFNFIFILISLILLLDFGYLKYKSKAIKIILKFIQLIQISTVLVVLYSYCDVLDLHILSILWYITLNLLYLICVFVLQLSKERNSFYTFQKTLHLIDEEFGLVGCSDKIELKFIVFYLSYYVYALSIVCFYCFYFTSYCTVPVPLIFFHTSPVMVAQTVSILFSFLFYAVYCRMLTLTDLVSNCTNDFNLCRNAYQKLANATERGRSNFSCMYFFCLSFYVTDTMLTVVYPLTRIGYEISFTDFLSANISVIPTLFIITAPIYTASQLSSQVNTLRLMLYDRLLQDKDKDHYVALQKFIRYIEARPFKFNIAGIIPLDWSLFAILLNVLVTYIIVLLQMTPNNME